MKKIIEAARGIIKSDIVFKNANIINVFTEEIVRGDVAVCNDVIVGVGRYFGEVEIDCTGKYISPGFIDAHMHIESTMIMPNEFAKAVMFSGTTTVIADPHEIVNVVGAKGVQFILDASENVPLSIYVMLPSSVPATNFETNGSDFTVEDIKEFINNKRILGLGEVMCFTDVLQGKDHILRKIDLCKDKVIDGHAPNITDKDLQAYVCAGVRTEHECSSFEEAYEKVKAGMKILVREGSAAKNCESIIKPLVHKNISIDNFLLCTDDKHLNDIRKEGHIRYVIKKSIDCNLDPIKAIKMATINTARTYIINDIGAIAPGYKADIVILSDLKELKVESVYKNGKIVNDEIFKSYKEIKIDNDIVNTVKINNITKKDIALKANEKNHVICIIENQILTKHLIESIPKEKNGDDEYFKANQIYNKLCVIERHRNTGNIKVAPLKGFGLKNAAIATTVAHDSHNIIVAGDNDSDILLAINIINDMQGGYVIVSNGTILGKLELKIAGLISTMPYDYVEKTIESMITISRNLGIGNNTDPFLTLSFLSLPVIPEIRLTDFGLIEINDKIKIIDENELK